MVGDKNNGGADKGSFVADLAPQAGEGIDPHALARRDLKSSLPKRFYKLVRVADTVEGFQIHLDGRPVRTPMRHYLSVASAGLAAGLADEWSAQQEYIDPADMPLTRIVNSALDGVGQDMNAVSDDIVKYAGSDLLCYRAGEPEALVAEQALLWDPLIDWMRDGKSAKFVLAQGVMFAAQPDAAISTFAKALDMAAGSGVNRALRLAAMHVMTTLSGSAILALAVALDHLSPQEAWKCAHVDEDFQARFWGEDAEAAARRANRWREMEAAARITAETKTSV